MLVIKQWNNFICEARNVILNGKFCWVKMHAARQLLHQFKIKPPSSHLTAIDKFISKRYDLVIKFQHTVPLK